MAALGRIAWVKIEGLRSIQSLTVELTGLQVLIGENGTGKTSIIEAFRMLARAGKPGAFTRELREYHGDFRELRRAGDRSIKLTTAFLDTDELRYELELGVDVQGRPTIDSESLVAVSTDRETPIFRRSGMDAKVFKTNIAGGFTGDALGVNAEELTLHAWGLQGPQAVKIAQRLLGGIEHIGPLDLRTRESLASETTHTMRYPSQLQPETRLSLGGANLNGVYHFLLNGPSGKREALINDVRKGLGMDVDLFVKVITVGNVQLNLQFAGNAVGVPTSQLSNGQLAYLCFVALKHIDSPASVLLIDEPELHLHPGLLVRVCWLLEEIAQTRPVIVATHSSAILDSLSEPADSVRVLELTAQRKTTIARLSKEKLHSWKSDYESLSEIRRLGLIGEVLEPANP